MNSEGNRGDVAQEYVTYEVTLPRGSEQGVALEGLANAFGWNVRERVALPSDLERSSSPATWRITDEQLQEISTEAWGSEVYGAAASHMLAFMRKNIGSYVVDDYDVYPSGERRYPRMRNKQEEDYHTFRTTNLQALERVAHRLWNELRFPFAPLLTYDEPLTRGELQPGDVTRERLAQYLRIHGIDRHEQHGTFGKAFDVMNVAAGLATLSSLGASHYEGTFIAKDEFESRLEASDLSRRTIRDALNYVDRRGRDFGRYNGEIVFEGNIAFGDDHDGRFFEYERVALESLLHMHKSKNSKMRPFVEGLIAEQAAG